MSNRKASLDSIQSIPPNFQIDLHSDQWEKDINAAQDMIKNIIPIIDFKLYLTKKRSTALKELNRFRELKASMLKMATTLAAWKLRKKIEFEEVKKNLDIIIYLKYQEENYKIFFMVLDNLLPTDTCGLPHSSLYFIKPDGEKILVKSDQLIHGFNSLKELYGRAQDQLKSIRKIHNDVYNAMHLLDSNTIGLYKYAINRKEVPVYEDLERLTHPRAMQKARTVHRIFHRCHLKFLLLIPIILILLIPIIHFILF